MIRRKYAGFFGFIGTRPQREERLSSELTIIHPSMVRVLSLVLHWFYFCQFSCLQGKQRGRKKHFNEKLFHDFCNISSNRSFFSTASFVIVFNIPYKTFTSFLIYTLRWWIDVIFPLGIWGAVRKESEPTNRKEESVLKMPLTCLVSKMPGWVDHSDIFGTLLF